MIRRLFSHFVGFSTLKNGWGHGELVFSMKPCHDPGIGLWTYLAPVIYIMKKFFIILCTALLTANLHAQLPDGSLAPDFTAEDTNGNSWSLYSLLGEGKIVVLNFFAAWDGYSWQYQQTGELENFYEAYGPDGTQQVMVLNIESEPLNTLEQLSGPENISGNNSNQTFGNWLEGSAIPFIDQSFLADSFAIDYIPTVLMICPNGAIHEISQMSAPDLFDAFTGLACPSITEGIDPAVNAMEVVNDCGSNTADLIVHIQNTGSVQLTTFDYEITGLANPMMNTWNGSLSTYHAADLLIEDVELGSEGMVYFTITSADNNNLNNAASASSIVSETSLLLQLELNLDNWPTEVSWEIRNSNDEVVFSDGDFAVSYEYFNDQYTLPADGCYSFYLYDTGGDGLHGSQWGGFDGSCYLRSLNGSGEVIETIYSYDGSYNFSQVIPSASFQKAQFLGLDVLNVNEKSSPSFTCYPNPADQHIQINGGDIELADISIDVFDLSGKWVLSKPKGTFKHGQKSMAIETNEIAEGYYQIKITSGNSTTVVPMVIVHQR